MNTTIDLEMLAADLERLANHLQRRACAPSLDGYELVDGLRAVVSLLRRGDGGKVHASLTKATRNMNKSDLPQVTLMALVSELSRVASSRMHAKAKRRA